MNKSVTLLPSVLLGVLASCWSASHPNPNGPAAVVDVDVASVSLADDCPDPVAEAAEADDEEPSASSAGPRHKSRSVHSSSMACQEGHCGQSSWKASCEQTTIQLSLRSKSDGGAKIAIKRIELIDAAGKSLGDMTARLPTRWTDDGEYKPWNERVAGRQRVTASYALSLPAGAGDLDVTETYRVRVTVSIDGEDRTLVKQATQATVSAPAIREPGVVT